MKHLYLLFVLLSPLAVCQAQDFKNGSFEINTVSDCQFNIANATFNSLMSYIRGIGDYEKLDIYYDTKCATYGLAQEGHYYATLENPIDFYVPTAMSFELSAPLVAGNTYTFSYYDRGSSIGGGAVDFGVSASNSTFGTAFHTQPDSSETTWKKRTVTFAAPIAGAYITARFGENKDKDIKLDNFKMEAGASIDESQWRHSVSLYPNPVTQSLQLQLPASFHAADICIFNLLGQQLLHVPYSGPVDVSSLAAGTYVLKVSNGQEDLFQSFVKH